MPNYEISYELETTRNVVVRQLAERTIYAATFVEALQLARQEEDLERFVVDTISSTESLTTTTQLLSVTEEAEEPEQAEEAEVTKPGLPPAYYASEPAPNGSVYNFIQVEPTPLI